MLVPRGVDGDAADASLWIRIVMSKFKDCKISQLKRVTMEKKASNVFIYLILLQIYCYILQRYMLQTNI